MSPSSIRPPHRARLPASDTRLRRLLLAQDGSTTRLCEAVAGGPVAVRVLHQAVTPDVPALVREHLPGARFIERMTSLEAHGEVLMDNLAYVSLHGLEPDIETDLLAGVLPIGHLLARWWVRRDWIALSRATELTGRLWAAVGLPDPAASRCHAVLTPEGPRMVIAETYRHGMCRAA